MAKTLVNKRGGPLHLGPVKGSSKPRVWAAGTSMKFEDEEADKLLGYTDVVELKEGVQAAKPAGTPPAPAGSGLAGKGADATSAAALPPAKK